MKKILVAVDGSEPALKGVRMAALLAKATGARLVLAYVSPPNLLPPHVYAEVIRELEAQERKYGQQILNTARAEAASSGVECDEVVAVGAAAEVIADLADDGAVDLVVVGSKGKGAVSRVMLGSVADRLVHVCKKPVLVAR